MSAHPHPDAVPLPYVPRSAGTADRTRTDASRLVPTALMVVAVLLSTGALLSLRVPTDPNAPGANEATGDSFNQLIWGVLYLCSAGLLFATRRFVPAVRRLPRVVWVLLAFALLSPLWSADPATSVRRLLALGGSTVIGLYLGSAFDRAQLLRITAWAVVLAVVTSFAIVILDPAVGISQDVRGPMWKGVFSHKSTLGLIMSWGVATTVLQAAATRGVQRAAWLAAAAGALALLNLSGSRTGILVLVLASALCWMLMRVVRMPRTLRAGIVLVALPLVAAVVIVVVTNLGAITASLGRDVTLTGRTTIWAAVWPSIQEHPWLGRGFDAFWGDANSPAADVWARYGTGLGLTDFHPASAHNAWLNLWLQLGVGAVVLFAATLAVAFRRAIRVARALPSPTTAAPLMFLLLYLAFTSVEGAMLTPNNIFWVLLVAYLVLPQRTPQRIASTDADVFAR